MPGPNHRRSEFTRLAYTAGNGMGSPAGFGAALALVMIWAASGPFLHFSTGWQLVMNTATNVITFLMVFLLQTTQNRDTEAIQIKLDELLRVAPGARPALIAVEAFANSSDMEIFEQEFRMVMKSGSGIGAYVLISVEVHDSLGFSDYVKGHTPILESYGGRIVAASRPSLVPEGSWGEALVVVQTWPDLEAFQRFYQAREYQPWKALRQRSARTRIAVVEAKAQ